MMGDPSHVPGQPQDIGTSKKNGVFPRVNTAACAPSAPITASFCNDNDEFCDSGTSLQVHESYVQVFGTQAAQFIVGKVGNSTVKVKKCV
jgi:acetylxylan esterase